MKRKALLIICLVAIAASLSAQTIQTSVTQQFRTTSAIDKSHTFNIGDEVSLIGYKKKGGQHHFAVVTADNAEIFALASIPFSASEKELKKLPNALSDEVRGEVEYKRKEIVASRYAARKKKALDGGIWVVVPKSSYSYSGAAENFYTEGDAFGEIAAGDTIYILGYTHTSSYHKFALYSSRAAGIFYTISTRQPFENRLNLDYLPSIDDTDVRIALRQKLNELQRQQEEADARYRNDALQGKVYAVLSYSYGLRAEDGSSAPFDSGDKVSILGYKSKGAYSYYALASDKGAGIYSNTSNPSSFFKNVVDVKRLPSVDDPEVIANIERRKAIADSLKEAKAKRRQEELIEAKKGLIESLKNLDPVLIRVTNWTTNSVGRVEVDITVSNGSPTETIKYISFQAYFTNPVGDRVRNEIGGGSIWKARGVGPISPRPTTLDNFDERWDEFRASYEFDNGSFYNSTAQYMHMSSVTIQYMSGRTLTLTGDKLQKRVIFGND